MNPQAEKALALFSQSMNCSQAVFAGCGALTGLEERAALATAGSFGGGMRIGSICGAVTGGMMALGHLFPFTTPGDLEGKERIGKLTLEFQRRFHERFGHLQCYDLLGEDRNAAKAKVCPAVIAAACEIVTEMAAEYK